MHRTVAATVALIAVFCLFAHEAEALKRPVKTATEVVGAGKNWQATVEPAQTTQVFDNQGFFRHDIPKTKSSTGINASRDSFHQAGTRSLRWQASIDLSRDSEAFVGRRFFRDLIRNLWHSLEENKAPLISDAQFRLALFKSILLLIGVVLFGSLLKIAKGPQVGEEFFYGFLVEQALSFDNLFVIIMLFDLFRVPVGHQGRVLTWGVVGSVALRGAMLLFGSPSLDRLKGLSLAFATCLVAASFKLLKERDAEKANMGNVIVTKLTEPVFRESRKTTDNSWDQLIAMKNGNRVVTPLFTCLLCMLVSDFVFAADSFPAVLGVSQDPIVVASSNIFAIVALRSLYMVVAKAVSELAYLKPAVALVLGFIGIKKISELFVVQIGTEMSLVIVSSLLLGGVVLSLERTQLLARIAGDGLVQLLDRYAFTRTVRDSFVTLIEKTNLPLLVPRGGKSFGGLDFYPGVNAAQHVLTMIAFVHTDARW